ncbi:hypothetical protein PROFUN_00284 [Planoprotostelium fungivorum]|uniref:Uncharacterized protein n=1 Tax=Planoprotostelium fungivorum TaxID=1890364 RepID=A0A2P6NXY8_9EUKA|nr:hypothetical protein PROFUN_00284 [Planoprotostelium fungivorum]
MNAFQIEGSTHFAGWTIINACQTEASSFVCQIVTRSRMKRQKLESSEDEVTPEALALGVLKAMDGAIVIRCPVEGDYSIDFTSDRARELIPHFVTDRNQWKDAASSDDVSLFWKTVHTVATTAVSVKKELRLESHITAKFQKLVLSDKIYVVVIAKKKKQLSQTDRFLLHGPGDEITMLSNAIENDLIGRILGMNTLFVSLTSDMWEPGVATCFAIAPNNARTIGITPHMARGKTTVELNRSKDDVVRASKLADEFLNPTTQRSSYLFHSKRENTTLYFETKRITPKLRLNVMLVRKKKEVMRPKLPHSTGKEIEKVYKKHQWELMLEDALEFIIENDEFGCTKKLEIPNEFFLHSQNIFCYVYCGEEPFLPSRYVDGFTWKSSFCTPSHGRLQKRYFYHKSEGKRLRRRVMWMEDTPRFCIIEYRHLDHEGDVQTDRMMAPDMMDWPTVISQISNHENHKLLDSMDELDREFSMGELRGDLPSPEIEESNHVLSYVSGILNSWAVQHQSAETRTAWILYPYLSSIAVRVPVVCIASVGHVVTVSHLAIQSFTLDDPFVDI